MTLRFELVTEPLPPKCGVRRGKKSQTLCELPSEHKDKWHLGRSPSGRWFQWEEEVDGDRPERRDGDRTSSPGH
jgi:hypothetical protein